MRIWDLPPALLCRQHLLGEHRELHGLWNILTLGKKGYASHPETRRWAGKAPALFARHEELAAEMSARGYKHGTPLAGMVRGAPVQDAFLATPEEQKQMLAAKCAGCRERLAGS